MSSSNPNCPFCLEFVSDILILHENQFCKHVACKIYVRYWLKNIFKQMISEKPTCPICRATLNENISDCKFCKCSLCHDLVPRSYFDAQRSICGDCQKYNPVPLPSSNLWSCTPEEKLGPNFRISFIFLVNFWIEYPVALENKFCWNIFSGLFSLVSGMQRPT